MGAKEPSRRVDPAVGLGSQFEKPRGQEPLVSWGPRKQPALLLAGFDTCFASRDSGLGPCFAEKWLKEFCVFNLEEISCGEKRKRWGRGLRNCSNTWKSCCLERVSILHFVTRSGR